MACPADILFYGGSAGGGKSFMLLMEALRYIGNKDFRAVIFRRISPSITNAGGLWDGSKRLYSLLNGNPNNSQLFWTFPSGARIEFGHLQHEDTVLDWKSSEIALLEFDQLEEFTETQFWYMTSRNRSMCGVRPYVRASLNPVPNDDPTGGWVHQMLSWWIDPDTGYPIPERDGVIRWFTRIHDTVTWFDDKASAIVDAEKRGFTLQQAAVLPKSFTFIAARLEDNQLLMQGDPQYYANLQALPLVDRERLYAGNWKIKPEAGNVFNRAWFGMIEALPTDQIDWVRYWDKAGTKDGGDWSAGVKMGFWEKGQKFIVADVVRGQWNAHEREAVIKQTAQLDGEEVSIWIEQEPGSGGKESASNTIINLAGFNIHAERPTGDKLVRAKPYAAQVGVGNVLVLHSHWTDAYLSELHNFSGDDTGHDDQVDGSSGAFAKIALGVKLELLNPEPTEEEEALMVAEANQAFHDRVIERGCWFPGD